MPLWEMMQCCFIFFEGESDWKDLRGRIFVLFYFSFCLELYKQLHPSRTEGRNRVVTTSNEWESLFAKCSLISAGLTCFLVRRILQDTQQMVETKLQKDDVDTVIMQLMASVIQSKHWFLDLLFGNAHPSVSRDDRGALRLKLKTTTVTYSSSISSKLGFFLAVFFTPQSL